MRGTSVPFYLGGFMNNFIVVDFETEAINGALPPKPVGVAITFPDDTSVYWAWGHTNYFTGSTKGMGNNITLTEAANRLHKLYNDYDTIVYHNSLFDLAVGVYHLGLPFPKDLQDTLFQLFLHDPHAATLSLKPSAEKHLGIPPEERDVLVEWILANVPKTTKKKAGAFICNTPVSIAGPYAMADTKLTKGLYLHFRDKTPIKPYKRECKLAPILVTNTLQGISLDIDSLEQDCIYYNTIRKQVDGLICQRFGRAINVNSGDELAAAIVAANIPAEWILTPKGRISTSKDNLAAAVKDTELLALLSYRGTLSTYLDTFYTSWLEKEVNGILHFSWNQVRNNEVGAGKTMGTRTGRVSSTPSLLNVPKEVVKNSEYIASLGFPPLPNMRKYLLADKGNKWLKRDYSAQELRILAHFEDGLMMQRYNENPKWDLHAEMSQILSKVLGITVTRLQAKTVAFSILYGSGIASLAEMLGCSHQQASAIKYAYLNNLPGVKTVMDAIKYSWNNGDCIKTWGGRPYYKEPSKWIKLKTGGQRWADFGYKGLNYLIQGSAADVSKQAIINYNAIKKDGRFMLMVHDELNISGPQSEMAILKEAMSDIQIDVPMLSDGKIGDCFGILTACD